MDGTGDAAALRHADDADPRRRPRPHDQSAQPAAHRRDRDLRRPRRGRRPLLGGPHAHSDRPPASLVAALAAGCKNVDCGDGTIERNGTCVPGERDRRRPRSAVRSPSCTATSACRCSRRRCAIRRRRTPDIDPTTGVITCIGTGGGGCAATFACPTPTRRQADDLRPDLRLRDRRRRSRTTERDRRAVRRRPRRPGRARSASRRSTRWRSRATRRDARRSRPTRVYIDDCGRYRVPDIAQPAGPFVALGDRRREPASAGPPAPPTRSAIATAKRPNTATKDFEAYIVTRSTTAGCGPAPSLAAGIYAPVYHGHRRDARSRHRRRRSRSGRLSTPPRRR